MIEALTKEERKAVAHSLKWNRFAERGALYEYNRNLRDYLIALHGLEHFLDYVRGVEQSSLVVDVGAGTTRAVYELSYSPLGKDLNFMATVLRFNLGVKKFLGEKRTRVTSAEKLRRIEDNSVAGIIANNSIGYSNAPEAVIKRIDQVLVPGGAIKANFSLFMDEFEFGTHHEFSAALSRLNYDIALKVNPRWQDLMVAIKPGGNGASAQELLDKDWEAHSRH